MKFDSCTMMFTHSLHKQFLDEPVPTQELTQLTALRGERISVQVLIQTMPEYAHTRRVPLVETELPYRLYRVRAVPVRLAAYNSADDGYLRKTQGLYPDLLEEYRGESLCMNPTETHNLWLQFDLPRDCKPGTYPLTVRLHNPESGGDPTGDPAIRAEITVLDATLPEQQLMCTMWFHSDCLADYYHVPVFSEEYWTITERYMRAAAATGSNMLLTPVLTPPLDTRIGGERTTVQLVDVTQRAGEYSFDFANLRRWVETAQRAGIRYFELSHLFTQWGAKACPKVIAHTEQGDRRIFGWDTPSDGAEYMGFLSQLLPTLVNELRTLGIAERCRFHLSDEPSADILPHYLKLSHMVKPLLGGIPVMDALSNYEFYEQGAVDRPVVALDLVQPFLAHHVQPLWVYYCCCAASRVSNRFIAMPSARNRILGFQLYLENAAGFLQWGFNFYNNVHSEQHINPYVTTDADGMFPAGDPFIVYPGADGQPVPSIRQLVFSEALQDQRACALLEQYTSRAHVCERIRAAGITGFFDAPYDADRLLTLRAHINAEIAAASTAGN